MGLVEVYRRRLTWAVSAQTVADGDSAQLCWIIEPSSAWSGQSIYNDTILSMVNVLYLSLPPLAQGIFEKDISEAAIYREPRVR